jgi:hypothetical protein
LCTITNTVLVAIAVNTNSCIVMLEFFYKCFIENKIGTGVETSGDNKARTHPHIDQGG